MTKRTVAIIIRIVAANTPCFSYGDTAAFLVSKETRVLDFK